jgi:dTMP kinase
MSEEGMFITIESVDGVGKTTLVNSLRNHFDPANLYVTKEPGDSSSGSCVGAGIRQLLFTKPTARLMAPGVADLLFLADHIQNSYDCELFTRRGWTVISDRYADSQFAYNAGRSKRTPKHILNFYQENYGFRPSLIIFLRADDIETGWTLKRAKARTGSEAGKQDGKPWNNLEEQMAIQKGYEDRFKGNYNAVTLNVQETDTPEYVLNNVISIIATHKETLEGYGAGV